MRYFFDSDDGETAFRDHEGAEFTDRTDAMQQAMDLLRDLSRGARLEGSSVLSCSVREGGETVVYRVTMVIAICFSGRNEGLGPPSFRLSRPEQPGRRGCDVTMAHHGEGP